MTAFKTDFKQMETFSGVLPLMRSSKENKIELHGLELQFSLQVHDES